MKYTIKKKKGIPSRSDLRGDDDHSIRLGLRTQWDAGRPGGFE